MHQGDPTLYGNVNPGNNLTEQKKKWMSKKLNNSTSHSRAINYTQIELESTRCENEWREMDQLGILGKNMYQGRPNKR